jgi:ABC-2 type transport system ATP-binding protein
VSDAAGSTSTNSSGAAISARGLGKYHGRFVALRRLTFSITRGQVVALLGPNGAGKTTLMRILTGYVSPSNGTAQVAGYDVERDRLEVAARVGYLPENGPLYLDMTPYESLEFFGAARSLGGAELTARIDTVARQCGIGDILNKVTGRLSKGLRQRVGMAQALLHDPDVLILDEPTTGLDPVQVREFRKQIRALSGSKTVLISTHILNEVDAIADRVLVLDDGALVFDGTPSELGAGRDLESRFLELVERIPPRTGGPSGAVSGRS